MRHAFGTALADLEEAREAYALHAWKPSTTRERRDGLQAAKERARKTLWGILDDLLADRAAQATPAEGADRRFIGKWGMTRVGGYDPALGRANHDPTLEGTPPTPADGADVGEATNAGQPFTDGDLARAVTFARARPEAWARTLGDMLAQLRATRPHTPPSEAGERTLARYDDGSSVALDAYAGGAAPGGAWSFLTLRFRAADGTERVRHYEACPEHPAARPHSPPSEGGEVELLRADAGRWRTVRPILHVETERYDGKVVPYVTGGVLDLPAAFAGDDVDAAIDAARAASAPEGDRA